MENYGNGLSTGQNQSGKRRVYTGWTAADLEVSNEDRVVLRKLAERVASLAAGPDMVEKRVRWNKLNSLEKNRPVIFCDPENGWNEIITTRQMECRGKIAQIWEMDLRKEIFWGEEMGDDRPVEPYFNVPYTISPDDWGLEIIEHSTDSQDGSLTWEAPIKDYDKDLPRLKMPTIEINWKTSEDSYGLARDIFGDILQVRQKSLWWSSLGITREFIKLRGLMNLYTDFYNHPEELKELLNFISQTNLAKIEFLEQNNLLWLNNDCTYVGSGGFGFTDELPQADFDGKVRTVDLWGYTESQETTGVGPDQYEEFVFPAEQPLMARFGLTCYGCCEELHSRWHVVKKHPGLRRVSCSPWTDVSKMSANLEDTYVLSIKPNPAALSTAKPNWEAVRQEIHDIFEITKDNVVELIMKDNHSLGGSPENVVTWCRIAKEESRRMAS
jgi:hypothetical protein